MNTFTNLLPSVGGNRPPLSDEELRRLAEMIQQRGEGLAAINPKEAQMLKDAGGSGKPLPGTKGLGVGGGPIRSYQFNPSGDYTGESGNYGGTDNTDDDSDVDLTNVGDLDDYYEGESVNMQADNHNETSIQLETDPAVIQAYNNKKNQGGGDGGGTTTTTTTTTPKFYDSLGGVHDTQEAADAATQKIVGQQNALEAFLKKELTSDMDFETFSEQFFKERIKVTPGKKVQVQTGGRPETFEEFVARSNLPSYSDYSKKLTEGNKTFQQWKDATKPETFEQYVARVGSSFQETGEDGQPVTVQKSRRDMIREHN